MSKSRIDELAKVIWDYHHMHHVLKKSDAILVLGSHDLRVGEYAVDLYLKGYAPYIIFSGGVGRLTRGVFQKTEAEVFAEIAVRKGIPKENILIEHRSSNTGENILFTQQLLAERGLDVQSFILVQKPYMERRTYATFKKLWPDKECIVTSPSISYEIYPTQEITKEQMINIMVGDLQRIKVYPQKGFQIPQEIPAEVWKAYEELVAAGFNKQLVEN